MVNKFFNVFFITLIILGAGGAFPQSVSAVTFTIYSDLTDRTGVSNITGSMLDTALKSIRSTNNGLIGYGQVVVDVARDLGLNPLYIAAHMAWETGWGTSSIWLYKNNPFGYGAYDRCPYSCALTFPTKADGIRTGMTYIKRDYLTSNGKYFHGFNLNGMNVHYATDQKWKNGHGSKKLKSGYRTFTNYATK